MARNELRGKGGKGKRVPSAFFSPHTLSLSLFHSRWGEGGGKSPKRQILIFFSVAPPKTAAVGCGDAVVGLEAGPRQGPRRAGGGSSRDGLPSWMGGGRGGDWHQGIMMEADAPEPCPDGWWCIKDGMGHASAPAHVCVAVKEGWGGIQARFHRCSIPKGEKGACEREEKDEKEEIKRSDAVVSCPSIARPLVHGLRQIGPDPGGALLHRGTARSGDRGLPPLCAFSPPDPFTMGGCPRAERCQPKRRS